MTFNCNSACRCQSGSSLYLSEKSFLCYANSIIYDLLSKKGKSITKNSTKIGKILWNLTFKGANIQSRNCRPYSTKVWGPPQTLSSHRFSSSNSGLGYMELVCALVFELSTLALQHFTRLYWVEAPFYKAGTALPAGPGYFESCVPISRGPDAKTRGHTYPKR